MADILGCGKELHRIASHPYIGREDVLDKSRKKKIIGELNKTRKNSRKDPLKVTYYFQVHNTGEPASGLADTARMILEHGTLKPWKAEGGSADRKPENYDEFMSWIEDIALLGYNQREKLESGLIQIAYPSVFFSKRADKEMPFAQMMTAIAGEPVSAFSFYQGAKILDVEYPAALKKLFPRSVWPHDRIRKYLCLKPKDPIIGTIVKPKTGLTPALFSKSVLDAALAGAGFTKADENMHLTLKDVGKYVGRVVKDLKTAGFDLGRSAAPKGKRFLFAPHITADAENISDYAEAALEAGANALMFSPYYGGGFLKMAEIIRKFDVPVYAHTAGMNMSAGCLTWGFDPRVMYVLAAFFGAAFMQITAVNGYLKPDDAEKTAILETLAKNGLAGNKGMTLAIAGGVGPKNIGINLKLLGEEGRMILAGTSVYSHPDGPGKGVEALHLAYRAFKEEGATGIDELKTYAAKLKDTGRPLMRALV